MKKVLIMLLAVMLLGAGSAFAQGISVDVGGGIGTSPTDDPIDIGMGFGGGLGLTYDLSDMVKNLGARVDFSYMMWSKEEDVSGLNTKVDYTRIPIVLGARYNAPIEAPVKVFGEAGLEVSMDKAKAEVELPTFTILGTTIGGGTVESEDSETHFGLAVGAGVAYPINEMISVGVNARYHIVTDPYLSAGVFVGYTIGK